MNFFVQDSVGIQLLVQFRYYLLKNIKSAMINIYMNGTQLKIIQLHLRGDSSITINVCTLMLKLLMDR